MTKMKQGSKHKTYSLVEQEEFDKKFAKTNKQATKCKQQAYIWFTEIVKFKKN